MMNKLQLIDYLAAEMKLSKRDASNTVECIFGKIKDCMKEDVEVNIGGFGAFKVKNRSGRKGINPKTGDRIDISPSKAPSFRPSKALKDFLNE